MKPEKAVKTVTVGGGTPGSVVTGPRTAVIMGGGTGEVDLDRVAASMERREQPDTASLASQPGAKQLGRSIAGALTGVAQNFKSKLVNMGANSVTGHRSSPSPPDTAHRSMVTTSDTPRMVASGAKVREVPIRLEQSGAGGSSVSPHVIPLTVPGAEYGQYHSRICSCSRGPLGLSF